MALAFLGSEREAESIATLLNDANPVVRRQAAQGLGWMGARTYADKVAPLLKANVVNDRIGPMRALEDMGATEHLAELVAALSDPDPSMRRETAFAVATLAARDPAAAEKTRAVASLEKLEGDDGEFVAMAASAALVRLGRKDRKQQVEIIRRAQMEGGQQWWYVALKLGEALVAANEPAYAKLLEPVELKAPVESADDLRQLFAAAGLELQDAASLRLKGRLRAGLKLPLRLVLWRVTGRYVTVMEGKRIWFVDDALDYWERRLSK
jgi:hypothetical protein